VLDAILSPEWEYRFFSFNAEWDSAKREDGVDAGWLGG
jgi:hypothetical protein